MALPAGLVRLTFQTTLGASEIALYGFHVRIGEGGGTSLAVVQELADKARDTWLDTMSAEKGAWSTAVVWNAVRADLISVEAGPRYGKVANSAFANFAVDGAGSYAGTNATSLPWECSAVVSMAAYSPGEFAVQKGRLRGRYYLPPYASSCVSGPTGEITSQTLSNQMAAIGDFHETLNDLLSEQLQSQIRLVVRSGSNDAVADVEHLWIDSKVDSQRRRENRQPAREKLTFILDD